MQNHTNPPALYLTLSEVARASTEGLSLVAKLGSLIGRHKSADPRPVLVMPGYGAADGSTGIMRHFLKRIGYRAFALGLGRNLETVEERIQSVDDATRFRERMAGLVVDRIRELHARTGEKISLVGWSMGGLYAVDAAREVPDLVRCVITLGSPFGDPRGTSLFTLMRRLSGSDVPLDIQNFDGWTAKAAAPTVPTRVIYSEQDGIVGTGIACLPESPLVEHVAVKSSHMAFAANAQALEAVAIGLSAVDPGL